MEKGIKITLIIAATILIIALIAVYAVFQLNSTNTVNVNGQATIKAVPDLITVYFDIQTKGATAKEAEDKNSEISSKLSENLVNIGFNQEDLKTQSFSVTPNYVWINNKQSQEGYIAVHSMKIQLTIDKLSQLGSVIDSGINSGSSISYINFELSPEKQNTYKAEALKLATDDARIKAEAIAEGLGKNLGRIVSVSDSSFNYYPWPVYSAESSKDARETTANIQPSEQDISSQVSVIYKLR